MLLFYSRHCMQNESTIISEDSSLCLHPPSITSSPSGSSFVSALHMQYYSVHLSLLCSWLLCFELEEHLLSFCYCGLYGFIFVYLYSGHCL